MSIFVSGWIFIIFIVSPSLIYEEKNRLSRAITYLSKSLNNSFISISRTSANFHTVPKLNV